MAKSNCTEKNQQQSSEGGKSLQKRKQFSEAEVHPTGICLNLHIDKHSHGSHEKTTR